MRKILLTAAITSLGYAAAFGQSLSWTTTTQDLVPLAGRIQMHGSAVCQVGPKKFIYAIGGNVAATAPGIAASGDTPYIYYAEILSTGTLSAWTTCTATLPVHPTTPTEPSVAYINRACDSYNGRIYVVGGNNNGAPPERTDLQILEPQANGDILSVTTVTPTGTYVARFEKSVVINQATGKLYVVGGGPSNAVDVAQIDGLGAVGAFSSAGTLLATTQQAAVVIKNNRLYVLGGFSGTSQATIHYATINGDGTLGTFANATAALPEGRFDGDAIASPFLDCIYMICGANAGNASTRNTVYRLSVNPGTGDVATVVTDSTVPTAPGLGLRRMGAVTDGVSVYLPGGRQDATNLTAQVYVSEIPSSVPTAATDWTVYE